MDNVVQTIASKLNEMGFPNEVKGNTIEARIPLPYSKEFVKPSFKLYYTPEQKLLYYKPNRYSTEKLLKKLKPALVEIASSYGLSLATREGIS